MLASDNSAEILLVEDDPNDVELTMLALKSNRVSSSIKVVRDGAEALDFLHRTGVYSEREKDAIPKVIMLDLKLPKVSGLEVLEQIKNNPELKDTPVVILTSSREGTDVEACYRLGANSYIVKPVDFGDFTQAVSKLGFYWLALNQPPNA